MVNGVDDLSGRNGTVGSSSESDRVLHSMPMESVGEHVTECGQTLVGNARKKFMDANFLPQVYSTKLNVGDGIEVDSNSPVSSTGVGNKNIRRHYAAADENVLGEDNSLTSFDVNDNNDKDSLPSLTDTDNNGETAGSLTIIEPETVDILDSVSLSKDMNEVSGVADDACSLSDIDELVEEKIEELESRLNSKIVEKKSRSQMKPLEFAEELEKKHVSTGLHWEEGAAANQ